MRNTKAQAAGAARGLFAGRNYGDVVRGVLSMPAYWKHKALRFSTQKATKPAGPPNAAKCNAPCAQYIRT